MKHNKILRPDILAFDPVPVKPRHDGWTAERQVAFIEALAETDSITEACRRVGMSTESVRKLHQRPEAESFRRAMNAALDYRCHRLEEAAYDRSINGVPRPIFYQGEQVGEWRHFDERLTMFMLRARRPERYGQWIGKVHPLEEIDGVIEDESAQRMIHHIYDIEEQGGADAAVEAAEAEGGRSRGGCR